MNERSIYELTIADKLQQLPIPDLADQIWASIETRLDLDLPSGNDGDLPVSDGPKGGGSFPVLTGTFIFVAALVTIFIINNTIVRKKENTEPQEIYKQLPPPNFLNDDPGQKKVDQREKTINPVKNDSLTKIYIAAEPDSLTGASTEDYLLNDTFPIQVVNPVKQIKKDTPNPKPKRRVHGISDSDYRIAPVRKDRLQ